MLNESWKFKRRKKGRIGASSPFHRSKKKRGEKALGKKPHRKKSSRARNGRRGKGRRVETRPKISEIGREYTYEERLSYPTGATTLTGATITPQESRQ